MAKAPALFSNGEKYVGESKDGLPNGQGTHTWPNGDKYVGEHKDGLLNGLGTYTWPGGDKYVGEWKDGLLNGLGTYTSPNGEKYIGEWKDSKRNGPGTLYSSDGSVRQSGIWKEDTLVAHSAENSALGDPETRDYLIQILPFLLIAGGIATAIFLKIDRTASKVPPTELEGAKRPQQKEQVQQSSPISVFQAKMENDLENGPRPVGDAEMDAWRASLGPPESGPEQVGQQPSPTPVSLGFKYYNGNGVAQDYKTAKMSKKVTLLFVACAFAFLITLGEMEPYGSKAHVIADKTLQGAIIGGIFGGAAALINALWNAIKRALTSQQKSSENGKIQSEKKGLIVSKPSAAKQGSQKAAFASNLSDAQSKIILTSMVTVAAVLTLIFLRFGYVYEYKDCLRLFILYDRTSPISLYSLSLDDEWGLLARSGVWGVLLGIVAPVFLCATAALIATGGRESR